MRVNFYSNNYISYKGKLKDNLHKGEKELKEFKQEVPYVMSDSLWEPRVRKIEASKQKDLLELHKKLFAYGYYIEKMRAGLDYLYYTTDKTENEHADSIKEAIKTLKIGNCGEVARVVSNDLSKKGIEHKNVLMVIKNGINFGQDHVFSVIGMDKDADLSNPSSWGNGAVVIDAWKGFVLSVPDAIKEYENFYCAEHDNNPEYSDFYFCGFDLFGK